MNVWILFGNLLNILYRFTHFRQRIADLLLETRPFGGTNLKLNFLTSLSTFSCDISSSAPFSTYYLVCSFSAECCKFTPAQRCGPQEFRGI